MEEELFEDLLESVAEAGSVLRGEREAARRTTLGKVTAQLGSVAYRSLTRVWKTRKREALGACCIRGPKVMPGLKSLNLQM
jgi:hypothetical protein